MEGYSDPSTGCMGQEARSKWDVAEAEFVKRVTLVYEGEGCEIIPPNRGIVIAGIMATQMQMMDLWAAAGRPGSNIGTIIASAGQKGLAAAQQPGACGYWQQNPEAAAALRQMAQDATIPQP